MIMDKLSKLSLPTTIILASLILGGSFYATQVNKQTSIEKQQQIELQDEQRIRDDKGSCFYQAEEQAVIKYQENCVSNCKDGLFDNTELCKIECNNDDTYYIADRENKYENCLQSKGLK
jgi:hypothetical protein